MCRYIKDDGDQCGRDAEPFCHDHEDTPQAAQFDSKGPESAESGSVLLEDATLCENCGTAVRAAGVQIAPATFQTRTQMVMPRLACACTSVAWDPTTPSVSEDDLPEVWYDG